MAFRPSSFGNRPAPAPESESDRVRHALGRSPDPLLDKARAALPGVMAGAPPKPADRMDLAIGAAQASGRMFHPDRHKDKLAAYIADRQAAAVKADKRARKGVSKSQLAAALIKEYPTARAREQFLASPAFARLSAGSQELIERVFIELELADAPDDDDVYEGSEGGIWAIQAGIDAENAAFDAQGDDDDEEEEDEEDEDDGGCGYAA